jgi:hypothetical protein
VGRNRSHLGTVLPDDRKRRNWLPQVPHEAELRSLKSCKSSCDFYVLMMAVVIVQ